MTTQHTRHGIGKLLALAALVGFLLTSLAPTGTPVAQAQAGAMDTPTPVPATQTVAATETPTEAATQTPTEICMVEGTVQLQPDAVDVIKSALASSIAEVNFNGAECFAPIDMRIDGAWSLITLVGIVNAHDDPHWTVSSNGVWSDNAILHFTDTNIQGAIAGTKLFSEELNETN